jgi:hypothetical protein
MGGGEQEEEEERPRPASLLPSDDITVEECFEIPGEDIPQVRQLFESAFPIKYGDQFYQGLEKGKYAGRSLVSVLARRNGVVVGAACASREPASDGYRESRIVSRGESVYLMTLAVEDKWVCCCFVF